MPQRRIQSNKREMNLIGRKKPLFLWSFSFLLSGVVGFWCDLLGVGWVGLWLLSLFWLFALVLVLFCL